MTEPTEPASIPTFPTVIDNSIRSAFVTCPRKAYWNYFRSEIISPPSIHLHAGATFAKGLEIARRAYYQDGFDAERAIELGIAAAMRHWGEYETEDDSVKSIARVCAALDFYLSEHWRLGEDYVVPYVRNGVARVEFSFAIPLPINNPQTGEPILYGGKSDMIGIYNDTLFIVDEKTTTQLGPTWSNKWALRAQFTGYCWAALEYQYPVAGAIIRGISFLKAGYEGQESIVYRPQWMIDQWYEQLLRDITRMVQSFEEDYFDYNIDESCSDYGGCPYLRLCSSPRPEQWLRPYYTHRVWDPLRRDEIATNELNENPNPPLLATVR